MDKKVKILAIVLTGSAVGAAAIAPKVLGTSGGSKAMSEILSNVGSVTELMDAVDLDVELKSYKTGLEMNLVGLNESLKQLEEQKVLVLRKDSLRREQYVQVDHLLACFKDAYLQGKSQSFPRLVFTQYYGQEQIEQMVQRLLDRRLELQGEENQSFKQIDQAIAQLNMRITETKRHLDSMPVYAALAVAGKHAGKSDIVHNALVSCLDSNHQYLAKQPIRYLPDASQMQGIAKSESPSARQFLAQTLPELPCLPSGELPTVSQLTAALREIVNDRK